MTILFGLLGLVSVLAGAYFLSNDKKNINFKAVGILVGFQLVVTFLMFNTTFGKKIVEIVSTGVSKLMGYGYEGIAFVTGGWTPEGASVFFINVLLLIVFTSTVLSLLTYIKVLPLAIKFIGGLIAKVTGLPKVEAFNAVNSVFFGQSEALLAVKSHIHKMNDNRLFVISTSAMSSVSASIMGAYMAMIPADYVLTAMVLNLFSGLIIATIVAPVKASDDEEINIKDVQSSDSIFGAISQGALDGGKVALIVAAMLIAYIGLMAMFNAFMVGVFGVTLEQVFGWLFAPVAVLMGVPFADASAVGSLMGVKLVANEFVAMLQLTEIQGNFSEKGLAVISTFLVSFANFSSIGIISGSMQAINGEKASVVAKFGLKLLLVATLVSIFSATLVGLFV